METAAESEPTESGNTQQVRGKKYSEWSDSGGGGYSNVVKDPDKQGRHRAEGGVCSWGHMKSDDVVDSLSAGCQSIN